MKKKVFNKLAGKGPKGNHPPDDGPDPAQEAARRQLEAARREAAERLGGSRVDPASTPPPLGGPAPSAPTSRRPSAPPPPQRQPAPPPRQAPPAAPSAPTSFGTPPSAGGAATPTDERRAITDMALEDLQRHRQAVNAESPSVVQNVRIPEEEYERRRPPAPGESLPGVPPPHIPSEDLRDQALREILERKERLDQEYRERHGMERDGSTSSQQKTRLHGGLAKRKRGQAQAAAPAAPPAAAPEQPAARGEAASTTTTGESVEQALAEIKGVGPVIRNALLERFDSVEAIKEADPDELTEVDGIGPALASRIKSAL